MDGGISRPLVVLGATGSIGTQTLDVARHLGLEVSCVAARSPSPALAEIATQWPEASVVAAGGSAEQREELTLRLGSRVQFGGDEVLAAAATPSAIVVNGIVGAAGLRATVVALQAGNRVALANKESLVAGGSVVVDAWRDGGGELIPVDSEHSALHQCLVGEEPANVARLVLTASGGPFRGWTATQLAEVTPDQALAHPTWEMGPRITIDSATLFNKGLEVIEAHHLFGVGFDAIDVLIHPESLLHSAVELVDGTWKGHLGYPDMRSPIQYALTYPERASSGTKAFWPAGMSLTFEDPDRSVFRSLDLAYQAGRIGGSAPAVLNAADEVAVEAFLQHRLGFLGIFEVVERTLEAAEHRLLRGVEDVIAVDGEARALASSLLAGAC